MGGCALTRNITNLFNSNDTEEASLTLDGINATSVCCGFLQNLTSGEIPTAWPKDCNETDVLHNGMKFAVNGNDCSSNLARFKCWEEQTVLCTGTQQIAVH